MSIIHPSAALYLIGFVGLFGPLVIIHEFGHYIVGRMCGVQVEAFSIGFGPELFAWHDKRGTRWRLALLPVGGYVRFFGDANAASAPGDVSQLTEAEKAVAFPCKPLWQRALIVAAGPFINLLFAAAIFACFIFAYGEVHHPPVVGEVIAKSAASKAGLKIGDRIISIAGKPIDDFSDILPVVMMRNNQPTPMVIERQHETLFLTVTPQEKSNTDRFGNVYRIGFLGIGQAEFKLIKLGPLDAFASGWKQVGKLIVMQADGLKQILTGMRPTSDMSGTLRMAKTAGEVASLGAKAFIDFIAMMSVAVGAINLLPIPMLDGGHLLLYAFEAVLRKPVNQRIQEYAMMSGFALVIGLALFSFWNDLQAMGVWQRLSTIF